MHIDHGSYELEMGGASHQHFDVVRGAFRDEHPALLGSIEERGHFCDQGQDENDAPCNQWHRSGTNSSSFG